jgi:hypothetical protein
MKLKSVVLLSLVAVVFLVAARPLPQPQAIVSGELHKAFASVCEHPQYPGLFLLYNVSDDCGREVFLYGDFSPDQVGYSIWAEGVLVENGSCQILNVSQYSICVPPDPSED